MAADTRALTERIKSGQLHTGEALFDPTRPQHTRPCADCPWSRGSVAGWLGGHTAADYIAAAHGEESIACHVFGAECAGAAIYRANVCQRPRDPGALQLEADRAAVFATHAEFRAHHEGGDS